MTPFGRGPEPQPCPPVARGVAHNLLTLEQQEAIALLRGQDVDDIFAYLKYARSASVGSTACREGSRREGDGLSLEQVDAIKTLSACTDRKIRTWLGDSWVNSDAGTSKSSQSSSPSAFSHAATRRPSAVPGHLSVLKSFSTGPSHIQPPANVQERPYLYRCTLCKEHRFYKHDSDWKKHEKEHEYTYICMPDKWRGATESGTKCVICGVKDPDDRHALEHNAQACSFCCKRRGHMTGHLNKCHGVYDNARGVTLAKDWLRGSGRQFWSCGLCVSLFPSLQERLKHIDVEHFRQNQSIDGWNVTNVIYGLLKQPGVCEAWEAQMTAQYGWQHPEIVWEAFELGNLQLKLEMGPSEKQSAVLLAEIAFDKCTTRSSYAWNETHDPAGDGHNMMEIGPVSFSSHSQSVSDHTSSTDPLAAGMIPWDVQPTLMQDQTGEVYGYSEEPTLCEPAINEPSFDQPADRILFSETESDDFADMEQWWQYNRGDSKI